MAGGPGRRGGAGPGPACAQCCHLHPIRPTAGREDVPGGGIVTGIGRCAPDLGFRVCWPQNPKTLKRIVTCVPLGFPKGHRPVRPLGFTVESLCLPGCPSAYFFY